MGHPDFRVRGKIFATLNYPSVGWAMIRLTPEDQSVLVGAQPEMFVPVKGTWGQLGATNVRLKTARVGVVREALTIGCQFVAAGRVGRGKQGRSKRQD